MTIKAFKTHSEQIELLKSRGMSFEFENAEACTKDFFSRIGYYRLVNGYKEPFIKKTIHKDDEYKTGTTIKELYSLYIFDDRLRELILKYVLKIETHIKSLIAYRISEQYGHDNYLRYGNFNSHKTNGNAEIISVIAEIHKSLSSRISDPSIKHYLTKYGYVPLWGLNNTLTFGAISKLYSIMEVRDRQYVSKKFNIPDSLLENFLMYLTKVRNIAAHGNRLYCMRNKHPISDTTIHENLDILKTSHGEYKTGKRDLFAAIIILRHLLSNNDFSKLINDLKLIMNQLDKGLNTISKGDITRIMGFPNNWEKIKTMSNKKSKIISAV